MLTLINNLEIKFKKFLKLEYSKTRAIFLYKKLFLKEKYGCRKEYIKGQNI